MNKRRLKRQYLMILAFLSLLFTLTACSQKAGKNEASTSTSQETTEEVTTQAPKEDRYVTMRSIGDILIHDTVYWDAATEDGGYDFDFMFDRMKPYIENADITTANLETLAAGTDIGLSSYPAFNGPSEIIDSLKNVGVDIVNNATNHTMDRGAEGALGSIKALKDRNMMYVGSYESWEDYNTPRIIDVDGVKFGFISYTYGLNGNYLPEDQTYLATMIDNELIALEVKRLKEFCDIAVVIFHMGEENDFYPSAWQDEVFNIAKDAGADFILGGHPHVLQPGFIWSNTQAGIYSHGNFISGQYTEDQKVGAVWEFTFKIDSQDKVTFEKMRLMPTYNLGLPEFQNYSVIPLAEAGDLGVIDVEAKFAELNERMHAYSDQIEVVEYLD